MSSKELIKESKRSYRGATDIILEWEEDGETHREEFSDENAAANFKAKLLSRLQKQTALLEQANEQAHKIAEISTRLEALGLNIDSGISVLERLYALDQNGPNNWLDIIDQYHQMHGICEEMDTELGPLKVLQHYQLLSEQAKGSPELLIEAHKRIQFLEKVITPESGSLEDVIEDYTQHCIEGVSLSEMAKIYRRYCESKMKTAKLLEEYDERLQKQESDEDERAYIMNKLRKCVSSFDGDIMSVSIDKAFAWVSDQPGSGSAKARLTELVEEFFDFLDEHRPQAVEADQ